MYFAGNQHSSHAHNTIFTEEVLIYGTPILRSNKFEDVRIVIAGNEIRSDPTFTYYGLGTLQFIQGSSYIRQLYYHFKFPAHFDLAVLFTHQTANPYK